MAELYVEEMSGADWLEVADNPRQRDTIRHWNKAKSRHLKASSKTHKSVSMARLPDGSRYKLDGHTRAYAWINGFLPMPAMVLVSVYEVADMEEVKDLYSQFDNSSAAETGVDRVSGAFREAGFVPQSTYLRHMDGVKTALTFADHILNGKVPNPQVVRPIYESVEAWLPELKLLDDIDAPFRAFGYQTLTAVLITLRRHPVQASEFWRLVYQDAGTKNGGMRDGVQAAVEIIDKGMPAWRGSPAVIGVLIWCFERWRQGLDIVKINRGFDYLDYVTRTTTPRVGRYVPVLVKAG